jgi:predicted nucleotidyltransferase
VTGGTEYWKQLSGLFGRRVDLVMTSALRNPWFRREAEKTRTLVYDGSEMPKVA